MTGASASRMLAEAYGGLGPVTVMEVCGTHTHSVARHGLRQLLPPNLRLISGPGCPVCVTADGSIRQALRLTRRPDTVVFSFGDMLRVPVFGPEGEPDSLYRARALGREVRVAASPMDALGYAAAHSEKTVIWFGVGFETTAPLTAAAVLRAKTQNSSNFFVLSAHKTMPAALTALLAGKHTVDALLCPGHVAVITGAAGFGFVPERLGLPGAVAGFEPEEILAALAALAEPLRRRRPVLLNLYPRAVTQDGNPAAQALLRSVLTPGAAVWRGLGTIPDSGLAVAEKYADYDALRRFDLTEDQPENAASDASPCRCAQVLRGELAPEGCPLFGKPCTPEQPRGPCMVSAEGACAAAWLYGGQLEKL